MRARIRRLFRPKAKAVAAATITSAVPESLDLSSLEKVFGNVLWARTELETSFLWLSHHVSYEHTDPMECDAWCVPEPIRNFIDELLKSPGHLAIIFTVLLKNHFWLTYENQQQMNSEG